MTLLLLLSALFSALTGVSAPVGRSVAPQSVSQTVAVLIAAPVARVVAVRPAHALPTLSVVAGQGEVSAFSLLPSEPAFAGRRRE